MRNNLSLIIGYINDNIIYGSKINREKIDLLLEEFSIKSVDESIVFDELKSLDITIVESKYSYKNKQKKLLSLFDENKELVEISLLKWFDKEGIKVEAQARIRSLLKDMGYKVIEDMKKEIVTKEIELLDIEDFEELDDLLDSEEFKENIIGFKNIPDKRNNIEYLSEFEKNKENHVKKSELLDNIAFANKKLVLKIVQKYKGLATASFTEEDMYQAGMQGLLKAVERFEVKKGYQFSTYATWWIRQNITRSIADFSTTIRIPVHMREKLIKLIRIENEFFNNYGRMATSKDLAEIMECRVDEIESLKLFKVISNLTSLETTIGDDEESLLIDFIPDDKNLSTEKQVSDTILKKEIRDLFNKRLTERETMVLLMRFGFKNGRIYTLEEIGKEAGVTRERIRQIELKALKKLKFNKVKERLGEFYYG